MEGERRHVTVLFADVVGSTSMAERLDPEEMVEVMNGAFGFMSAAVNRYGGTVERLMGDSVLAFFGARQAHEDDAERAIRAGLEIREEAKKYARSVRARFSVDFQVRVGINTGLVVAGTVGTRLGQEFTTTGDAPNVAARLQAAATPGTVLISAGTYRLAAHAVDVRSLGPLEVKGKSAPVEAFEVLAAKAVPERARGLERQGLSSPLVGRDAEMALLRARLRDLSSGQGGVVAIVAEAGLGKSRLLAELQAGAAGVTWLEGRALSFGQSMPYHAWKPVGRRMIGADDSTDAATVRRKLRELAGDRVPAESLTYLETMLGAGEAQSAAHEGADVVQLVANAVMDLVRAAIRTPTVLVMEDLHWADSASLELVAQVAGLAASGPLLLVCALRPHKKVPSWTLLDRLRGSLAEFYTQIDLAPLDAGAADQLLGNLLQVKDLPESIRTRILERSEGNPFYLEEVLRSLIDSGHIVSEGEHWRATREIEEVTIPDTLAGVLSARIDRLPDQARKVAQTAAVLGREFPADTLEVMCRQVPEPDRIEHVLPHLLTLTYEELLRRRPDAAQVYKFKHALTREAAYGLLLRARRRQLHGIAAAIVEREMEESGRREELAPVVGLHYFEAGEWLKAATHLAAAARTARRLYALREEGEHWEHVLRALDNVEDPDAQLVFEATEKWIFVCTRLDELRGRVILEPDLVPAPWYVRAEQLARERGDRAHLAMLLSWLAGAYGQIGRGTMGIAQLRESEQLAREVGDDRLLMLPLFISTMALIDKNPTRAAEQSQQVLELAQASGDVGVEAHARGFQAVALARLGLDAEARAAIDKALELAPRAASHVKEADAHIAASMAYFDLGDMDKAAEHARIGAEKAAAVNAFECACSGYYALGKARLARDQVPDALSWLQRAMNFGNDVTNVGFEGFLNRVGGHEALARYEQGASEAVSEIETRLENARKNHDEFMVATLSEDLGRGLLSASRPAEAEPRVALAIGYYRDTGMAGYLARALDIQAQVHDALGRGADAARDREAAAELRGGTSHREA